MLEKEVGDRFGFRVRFQKNQSTIVYDVSNGGSFIEVAINTWGVSEDNLIKYVARRLQSSWKESTPLSCPLALPPLQFVRLLLACKVLLRKLIEGHVMIQE